MTGVGGSAAADGPFDDQDGRLVAGLARAWLVEDPMPPGLVDRICFRIALGEVEAEVARVLDASDLHVPAAAVRSADGEDVRTLTFASSRTTIMVQVTPATGGLQRLDGWVDPAGPWTVRLRLGRAVHEAPVSEAGRFQLTELLGGTMQLSLVDDGVVIMITPAFEW